MQFKGKGIVLYRIRRRYFLGLLIWDFLCNRLDLYPEKKPVLEFYDLFNKIFLVKDHRVPTYYTHIRTGESISSEEATTSVSKHLSHKHQGTKDKALGMWEMTLEIQC